MLTRDSSLAANIRGELPQMEAGLRQSGWAAEFWAPAAAKGGAPGDAAPRAPGPAMAEAAGADAFRPQETRAGTGAGAGDSPDNRRLDWELEVEERLNLAALRRLMARN